MEHDLRIRLEDMYPFLDREELEANMYIPLPEKMRQ